MDDRPYFIEALLSKKHKEPLLMVNKEGENFSFEKVGVKRYKNKDKELLYCVLRLLEKTDEVDTNQLLVYRVEEDSLGNIALRYECNHALADAIINDILRL
ncbi:MAG: hypothetical protein E7355_01675 [Clostridiales bacterium]|nr:hypothetical protein [Clostridiales bacterium]